MNHYSLCSEVHIIFGVTQFGQSPSEVVSQSGSRNPAQLLGIVKLNSFDARIFCDAGETIYRRSFAWLAIECWRVTLGQRSGQLYREIFNVCVFRSTKKHEYK